MAAFIAKQMVGNQLKSVTGAFGGILGDESEGAIGGDKEGEEKKEGEEQEEDPEIAEARREAEEKRKEKHRKMEEEREELRQSIRDKYGLKKREKTPDEEPLAEAGRIGRKKKTPAELAAENNADSDDEDLSSFPKNFTELQTKVSELPTKLAAGVGEVTQKCVVQ